MAERQIKLKEGERVFFTSDTHYGHKNICKGVSNWDLKESNTRYFETLEDMNDAIVDGINRTVGKEDYLVIAGDFSFGGIDNVEVFRGKIICDRILFVLGNHDQHIRNNKPLPTTAQIFHGCFRTQHLFESVDDHLILTIISPRGEKTTYNIFHYPIVSWDKAHHGRVHLYGHVHNSFTHPGRALDVGVDSAYDKLGEYRPFSEEDIKIYMANREFTQFSHHNSKTN